MEWKPIETAPKDTFVLTWCPDYFGYTYYALAALDSIDDRWRTYGDDLQIAKPTHWMHLPERPESPAKFPTPKWMDEGEAKVIREILTAAEDRGYLITVIDSIEGDGERVVNRSDDYAKAWEELFHTDSAILIFWAGDQRLGFVSLIFSNGRPEEVISDCTDRPEILELMPEVEA